METIALLYTTKHPKKVHQELAAGLQEFGVDPEVFFQKENFKIHQKYSEKFLEAIQVNAFYDFFFELEEPDFILGIIEIFMEVKQMLIDQLPNLETELVNALARSCLGMNKLDVSYSETISVNQLMKALKASDLSDNGKWKMLLIFQEPLEYFQGLWQLIELNMPGYEKAKKEVEPELKKMVTYFFTELPNQSKNSFVQSFDPTQEQIVYPMLALPFTNAYFESAYYVGFFSDEVLHFGEDEAARKKLMLLKLKNLGDKSKLEILFSLMEQPKYSLEIAHAMNLSPSTTSHHMSALLSSQLVIVKKEAGRIFYQVNSEEIQKLQQDLGFFFLK